MGRKDEFSDLKEGEKVQTVFSSATSFDGTLRFSTSIRIEGGFRGKILSDGYLMVGENAKVRANIRAKSIVIAGEVRGDVEADDRLEMLPTGKLFGNIKTRKLKMADGVVFEGSCEMIKPGTGARGSGNGDSPKALQQTQPAQPAGSEGRPKL